MATSLCWPGGVPAQTLVPTTIYFLQKPNEMWMLYERAEIRRIFLNANHQPNPKPTWFGDEVGHYEGGDTLVVDTIGLSDSPVSFIDDYRTPHTLEAACRRTLQDAEGRKGRAADRSPHEGRRSGYLYLALGGLQRYGYSNRRLEEVRCAENNPDYFGLDDYSVPTGTKLDF